MAQAERITGSTGGYLDYLVYGAVVKNTTSGNYAVVHKYVFMNGDLNPTNWTIYSVNGSIKLPGYNYGTNKTINGIEYIYTDTTSGALSYSGKYYLCLAEDWEGTAYSSVYYTFVDNGNPRMPQRIEYFATNSSYFPYDASPASGFPNTKSICKGPINVVLKGLEIQMAENITKYELPGYLDITDYE